MQKISLTTTAKLTLIPHLNVPNHDRNLTPNLRFVVVEVTNNCDFPILS